MGIQEKDILSAIEEIMEVDSGTVESSMPLAGMSQWDSMSMIAFISVANSQFGKKIAAAKLAQCKTVADLVNLILK